MHLNRENLPRGGTHLGFACTWPCPGIIEAIGGAFDFCWIDAQHGSWELRDVLDGVRACSVAGTPAVVRVADHSYGGIGRVLDLAPAGVIVPCIDDAAQARAVVDAARFPPVGNRSVGGRRASDLHGASYCRNPEVQPLLIAQIETPAGVENVRAIARMEGVDALLFGPADLTLRMGLPGSTPLHGPELAPIARAVAAEAAAAGIAAMTVAGTPDALEFALYAGYTIVSVATDAGWVKAGAAASDAMMNAARGSRP